MTTDEKCSTCDGTGAVAVEVNGVKGIDSCPACNGTGKKAQPANDTKPKRFAPLVPDAPTTSLSACIAACVASAYGQVSPRLVDSDDVTVVERIGGAR